MTVETLEVKFLSRDEVDGGITDGKFKRTGVGKIPNNFAMWGQSSRDMYLRGVAKLLGCDVVALPSNEQSSEVLYCKTNPAYKPRDTQ